MRQVVAIKNSVLDRNFHAIITNDSRSLNVELHIDDARCGEAV
jgi:hypothetical protein